MDSIKKRLLAISCSVVFLLSAVAGLWLYRAYRVADIITDEALQDTPTIARIKENGTLLVGTTGDYRPLTFLEPDGSYWGFGIELAKAIAHDLDVDVNFVATSWPDLTEDVLAEPQLFDLAIGGITITEARQDVMLMSEGYLANGKTILCRKADEGRFQKLEDIDRPDVRVMVNPGGTNEQFAHDRLTHASVTVHPRNEEIPSLIAEGKADVMITEVTEAPYYVSAGTGLGDGGVPEGTGLAAPMVDTPFTNSYIGVLMRRGQGDLMEMVNELIRKMKADGSLRALHEKYGLVYAF